MGHRIGDRTDCIVRGYLIPQEELLADWIPRTVFPFPSPPVTATTGPSNNRFIVDSKIDYHCVQLFPAPARCPRIKMDLTSYTAVLPAFLRATFSHISNSFLHRESCRLKFLRCNFVGQQVCSHKHGTIRRLCVPRSAVSVSMWYGWCSFSS